MTKRFFLILFFCSALFIHAGLPLPAQEQRTWSDSTGKFKIEAKLQRIEGDKVFLETADGNIKSIPLTKLSKEDQEYAASQKDNPFADEVAANPFASEGTAKSNSATNSAATAPQTNANSGFDMEPKPINSPGTVSFTSGNNTSWNCQPDADAIPSFGNRPPTVQLAMDEMPFGTNAEYDVFPYFTDGKHYVLAAIRIKLPGSISMPNRPSRSSVRDRNADKQKTELNGNETRFIFCNLETGEMQSESVPHKLTILDIAPDGTAALFRSGTWDTRESGTKNVLYIADIVSQKVKVKSAYAPFDNERTDFQRDISYAAVINKDTVLIKGGSNNSVIVFNIKNERIVWKTSQTTHSNPVFSTNRKYCIVNGSMLETATGKNIGKFDTNSTGGEAFSLSPDGKTAVFNSLSDNSVTFFDALTGQKSEPFFTGAFSWKHNWTNNQFVLISDKLVDSKTKAVVWRYSNSPEFYFGGYSWYLCSGAYNGKTLVPVKLPHPAAAVNALKPEWAVAPGKEVALKIDGSISERRSEIAAHIEKILKDNGVRIRDNAPIVVEASVKLEKESNVYYVTGGRFGMPPMPSFMRPNEGGTEIKYIPEVYSVQVKKGDKVYWGTSKTKAPPNNVSLDEIKKSSLQEVVKREMAKIKYADWFLEVKIPKQIPGGEIGNSMISATGITDFTRNFATPDRR